MSTYMTEAEQLEAIKKWWIKNQSIITGCLAIVLCVVAGYRYFNWHQDKVNQKASVAYENMMMSLSKQDDKSSQAFANQLIADDKKSVYSTVAHFTLAKVYIAQSQFDKAKQELKEVIASGKTEVYKEIASIRLARILASEKSYDEALATLSSIDHSEYYRPVVNELEGDIYSSQGEYAKASVSYEAALNETQASGRINQFLQMKNETMKTMKS